MPSVTVENYLKALHELAQDTPAGDLVAMGRLAAAMQVTPGTATAMAKTLDEAGLVAYEPRGGVQLSARGRKLALHVLRRHRLVELFLVRVLKLDWSQVHDEAEELEHAISDKLLERIDELLGRPEADPHGDPIPRAADLDLPSTAATVTLLACPIQQPHRVARVLDQDADFLQFAERHGLTPGSTLLVTKRDPAADAVTLRPQGKPRLTLGAAAAAKVLVEPIA
jgi:DtxR family Mn-dependent transcriptional regulator